MIFELKLRKVGNSVGIVLPRTVLDHLGLGSTGSVFMTPMPGGALRVSALDPDFAQKVRAAELGTQEYANTLQWLMSKDRKPAVQPAPTTQSHGNQEQP